jgi:transposase-like protein
LAFRRLPYAHDSSTAHFLESSQLPRPRPIKRLNDEIKRRTEVAGIFSNEDVITRLVGGSA